MNIKTTIFGIFILVFSTLTSANNIVDVNELSDNKEVFVEINSRYVFVKNDNSKEWIFLGEIPEYQKDEIPLGYLVPVVDRKKITYM